MGVAAEAVLFLPDYQASLTVGLQAKETVNDVGAGFFQLAGPLDVVEFVKTGTQFDQRRDLLAITGRFFQGLNHRGIATGAVER